MYCHVGASPFLILQSRTPKIVVVVLLQAAMAVGIASILGFFSAAFDLENEFSVPREHAMRALQLLSSSELAAPSLLFSTPDDPIVVVF